MRTIKINQDEVRYCIKKLASYTDLYTTDVVSVFEHYLDHQNFDKMRDDLEALTKSEIGFHNKWDLNARIGFLEVIYPA